jgi:hypothetical protein
MTMGRRRLLGIVLLGLATRWASSVAGIAAVSEDALRNIRWRVPIAHVDTVKRNLRFNGTVTEEKDSAWIFGTVVVTVAIKAAFVSWHDGYLGYYLVGQSWDVWEGWLIGGTALGLSIGVVLWMAERDFMAGLVSSLGVLAGVVAAKGALVGMLYLWDFGYVGYLLLGTTWNVWIVWWIVGVSLGLSIGILLSILDDEVVALFVGAVVTLLTAVAIKGALVGVLYIWMFVSNFL